MKISPDFIQARLRLAEAMSELEDVDGAREVLLKAQEALPANARLKHDDQLRLEAVRSSVLRNHDGAISAYRQLADRAPREAAAWLDVGRAEEAAGLRVAAMQHYEQAVKLDGQSAAAHQRLGVLQSQGGLRDLALKSLGEAIRLHHVNSNLEGEAEATLRKATVHIALQDWAAASAAVGRVVEIAKNPDFVSLRLRAQFELARVAQLEGRFEEAEKLFSDALHEAISNEMGTIAADGLRGLATLLTFAGRLDDADAQLVQAINIAVKLKASRAEAQARLQQASLRLAQDRHADAIALVEAPLRFVTKEKYVRNEAEAKSILARAHESLEHYDEAHQLASEVLKVAESLEDPVLTGLALDNLAGQAERLGQLVEALTLRERLEKLHRDRNDHSNLAFDLVNRADLLIRLGRGADAEVALADVERAAAEGRQDYKNRLPTVSLMRALRASIEGRYGEVVALARAAEGSVTAKPSDNALLARLLAEHALARLGRSRIDVNEIAAWPAQASEPALSREMTYWAARTLIERRSDELARKICQEAWGAAPARTNLELRWRLAALVGQAAAATTGASDQASSATMRTSARDELQKLLGQWVGQGVAYIARPDLAALRKGLS